MGRRYHSIQKVDYAFIDGTFLDSGEINHRDISEIPHPFISETMDLFSSMPLKEKNKIYFIHLNHTNPGLDNHSEQAKKIRNLGFHVAHYLREISIVNRITVIWEYIFVGQDTFENN